MTPREAREPALDLFWEEADLEAAADHPLERELAYRIDALVRCERLIADAGAAANDDAVQQLTAHYRRQARMVATLLGALRGDRHS